MAKKIKKSLLEIFNGILENFENNAMYYKRSSLSFYDHWLSEREADEVFRLKDFNDYKRYNNIEITIVEFLSELSKVYKTTYFDKDDKLIYDFDDYGDFVNKAINGLREVNQFIFYIESLDLILISGFDQDIWLFFISGKDQSDFVKIVKNSKLHLLD